MKKISLADKIVSKTSFTFRTVFNLSEMICLKEKALLFAKKKVDSFQEINFLYRFKSKNYFENVYFHNEGSPLPKHKKDKTGHFANPTIDHIRGVFFAGTVNKFNEMPEKSPFGDTRFEVEVHKMLNPEKSNIYFSDFYCVRSDYAKRNHLLSNFTETGHRHYITLVVTDKNSYENDFCSRYFEKIDLINGPNLRIIKQLDGNYKYYWNTNSAIATEIFYTPTMSMADGKFKRDCKPLAKGCSTANGIGHAKRCTICNN
uniref:PHYHIP_C domain-containing protein n=1 Tax=Rhabditophanes sp. KR3021 TaxID=114890 RepID=A0AC35TSK8_9BILA